MRRYLGSCRLLALAGAHQTRAGKKELSCFRAQKYRSASSSTALGNHRRRITPIGPNYVSSWQPTGRRRGPEAATVVVITQRSEPWALPGGKSQ